VLLGDNSDYLPGVYGLGPVKLFKLYPQINEEKFITLNEIINFATLNIDKNKLYASTIERNGQLLINNKLMNLKEIFLSEDNIKIISDQITTNKGHLETQTFLQMYNNDNLQESIPNVHQWLNQNFGFLNFFN
jgi:5'-3' exonuclease